MQRTFSVIILLLACGSANAALLSRLSGQAYDDVLDITWIAVMNPAAYLGKSDWRLPTVTDTGSAGCNFAYTGTDFGLRRHCATGPGYDPG